MNFARLKTVFSIAVYFLLSGYVDAQSFDKLFSFQNGNNTNEYAYSGIEAINGNYLIGINNRILCLSPTGDSLWSKEYATFGDIRKLFRDQNNQLLMATTRGRMTFVYINELNGDTISSIFVPSQPLNYGYTIYDALVLPDGDIVYSYNLGSGLGGIIRRFTPGTTVNKWSNDYAGENWAPKAMILDDTTLVMAGYRGTSTFLDMYVRKISVNNLLMWSKQMARNTYYSDRLLGIQKNSQGNYLVASSWALGGILAPAVVKLSSNGDSLATSYITNFNNAPVNHGYLTSLLPGSNGFLAAGQINQSATTPDQTVDGIGYMCMFSINDAGEITGAKAYNQLGFYQISLGGPYDGSEAWGNGCFPTSDGSAVVYGVGTRVHDPGTGANYQTQWRGYVCKGNQFLPVTASLSKLLVSDRLDLYPNPAANSVTIQANDNLLIDEVALFSVDGRILIAEKCAGESRALLDINEIPTGSYLVVIKTNYGLARRTLIKQ